MAFGPRSSGWRQPGGERCTRPYGPFAEALADYARRAELETLKADLGSRGTPLARLVPVLRERLPDLPEPAPLQPDEERTRLIDAVTQFLLAVAERTPTVLVLDDLHWADAGTVALLRHLARFAPRGRLLVVGAYRDVEVGREHPLADVLGVLPRETTYDQVALGGLEPAAVQELLEAVADQEVAQRLVATITRETSGNPFFIRAVLLHLLEDGALRRDGGRWTLGRSVQQLGLPETVRQVIEQRLGRVSEATTRLLRVAAAFTGGIDFEVARRVAGNATVSPSLIPDPWPLELVQLRESVAGRAGVRWVPKIYARHRGTSSEIARREAA